jgi:peptidoglycan/LPS O-acetylase OafA/YrhL
MPYRPEIDGLRAVAVLPVILFHAGFSVFSGGFVGVDVFFVISGYLITSILLRELAAGKFSILGFYERRARRILPALFLVILACLPFAWAWMLPWEFQDFGRSVVAVTLFGSNILFWSQGGYFAASAEGNTLLHTWSLAVEEQYYILFPLALGILWRFGLRVTAGIFILIGLISIGLSEWGWRNYPTANFYLLPTRAWELLAGSLLALWLARRCAPRGALAEAGSAAGIVMILYAILSFDKTTPFPGLWGLLPVGGTVLVVLCASHATWVGRLLSLRPVVGIGLISYSAYLWHQPLFAFARIRTMSHPSPKLMLALATLSLVLAWISWRYVERPFRNRVRYNRITIFKSTVTAMAISTTIGATIITTNGFQSRFPEVHRHWLSVAPHEFGNYVKGKYITQILNRPFQADLPKLLIIGDSFSQDFYNVIRENNAFSDYSISGIYIPTECQIYLGDEDISSLQKGQNAYLCDDPQKMIALRSHVAASDVVLIAFRWREWAIERLEQTLEHLALSNNQKLILITNKSFEDNPRRHLSVAEVELPDLRFPVYPGLIERNSRLASAVPPETLIVDIPEFI